MAQCGGVADIGVKLLVHRILLYEKLCWAPDNSTYEKPGSPVLQFCSTAASQLNIRCIAHIGCTTAMGRLMSSALVRC